MYISTLFKTLVCTYHILLFCQKTGRILKWICWSNRWWFWTCHVCNHRPSACKRLLSPAAFDPSDLKLRIASEGFFTPRIGFDLIDGKLASQPRTHRNGNHFSNIAVTETSVYGKRSKCAARWDSWTASLNAPELYITYVWATKAFQLPSPHQNSHKTAMCASDQRKMHLQSRHHWPRSETHLRARTGHAQHCSWP